DYAGGDGNDVTLALTRNDIEFASVGQTRNQKATAGAIDTLGNGQAVWNAIAIQTDEQTVRASFDALSGEIHASAGSVLMEHSAYLRNAVNDRIRAAFDGVAAQAMPVLAYAEGGRVLAEAQSERFAAWGQVFGS